MIPKIGDVIVCPGFAKVHCGTKGTKRKAEIDGFQAIVDTVKPCKNDLSAGGGDVLEFTETIEFLSGPAKGFKKKKNGEIDLDRSDAKLGEAKWLVEHVEHVPAVHGLGGMSESYPPHDEYSARRLSSSGNLTKTTIRFTIDASCSIDVDAGSIEKVGEMQRDVSWTRVR
jgi:hypothetical protein